MTKWKTGVIPKGCEAAHLRICEKCGLRHYYYGSAFPGKVEKCDGCKIKKLKGIKKKGFVTRNTRVIKRN